MFQPIGYIMYKFLFCCLGARVALQLPLGMWVPKWRKKHERKKKKNNNNNCGLPVLTENLSTCACGEFKVTRIYGFRV